MMILFMMTLLALPAFAAPPNLSFKIKINGSGMPPTVLQYNIGDAYPFGDITSSTVTIPGNYIQSSCSVNSDTPSDYANCWFQIVMATDANGNPLTNCSITSATISPDKNNMGSFDPVDSGIPNPYYLQNTTLNLNTMCP